MRALRVGLAIAAVTTAAVTSHASALAGVVGCGFTAVNPQSCTYYETGGLRTVACFSPSCTVTTAYGTHSTCSECLSSLYLRSGMVTLSASGPGSAWITAS